MVEVDNKYRAVYNAANPGKEVIANVKSDVETDIKVILANMANEKTFDTAVKDVDVYLEEEKEYETWLKTDVSEKAGNEAYKSIGITRLKRDIEVKDPFMQEWMAKEVAEGRDISDSCVEVIVDVSGNDVNGNVTVIPTAMYRIKDTNKKDFDKFTEKRKKELNEKNRESFQTSRLDLVKKYLEANNLPVPADFNKDNYPKLITEAVKWEKVNANNGPGKAPIVASDRGNTGQGNANADELSGWKLDKQKFFEEWCKKDSIKEVERNPHYAMETKVSEAGISFVIFASEADKEAGKQKFTVDYKDKDNVNVTTPDGKSADYEAWRAIAEEAHKSGQPINLAGITNEQNMKKMMIACQAMGVKFIGHKAGIKIAPEELKALGVPEKDIEAIKNQGQGQPQGQAQPKKKTEEEKYKDWLKDEMNISAEPAEKATELKALYEKETKAVKKYLDENKKIAEKASDARKYFAEGAKNNTLSQEEIDLHGEYNDSRKDYLVNKKVLIGYSDSAKDSNESIDSRMGNREKYVEGRFAVIDKQQALDSEMIAAYTKANSGQGI